MKSHKLSRLLAAGIFLCFCICFISPHTVYASDTTENTYSVTDFDSLKTCLEYFSQNDQSGTILYQGNGHLYIREDYTLPKLTQPVRIDMGRYSLCIGGTSDFSDSFNLTLTGTGEFGVVHILPYGHLKITGASVTNTSEQNYYAIVQKENGCLVTSSGDGSVVNCDEKNINWSKNPVICSQTDTSTTVVFKTADGFSALKLPADYPVSLNYRGGITSASVPVSWNTSAAKTGLNAKKRTEITGTFTGSVKAPETVLDKYDTAKLDSQIDKLSCTAVFTKDGAGITDAKLKKNGSGYILTLSAHFPKAAQTVNLMMSSDKGKTWKHASSRKSAATAANAAEPDLSCQVSGDSLYYFCIQADYGSSKAYTDVVSCEGGSLDYVGDYPAYTKPAETRPPVKRPTVSASSSKEITNENKYTGAMKSSAETAASRGSTGRTASSYHSSSSTSAESTVSYTAPESTSGSGLTEPSTALPSEELTDDSSGSYAPAVYGNNKVGSDSTMWPVWLIIAAVAAIAVLIVIRHFVMSRGALPEEEFTSKDDSEGDETDDLFGLREAAGEEQEPAAEETPPEETVVTADAADPVSSEENDNTFLDNIAAAPLIPAEQQ